ncbi:hypothetical protein WMF04_47915 [Sorangium sp. So ce260]|uniref:hypothetical protein n=1 Tax=Sorangium sp. So ce260 TaxID=3133291 RepID=UPI003F621399
MRGASHTSAAKGSGLAPGEAAAPLAGAAERGGHPGSGALGGAAVRAGALRGAAQDGRSVDRHPRARPLLAPWPGRPRRSSLAFIAAHSLYRRDFFAEPTASSRRRFFAAVLS